MGHWICAGHNPIWQNMVDAQGDHSRGGWTYKWVISKECVACYNGVCAQCHVFVF